MFLTYSKSNGNGNPRTPSNQHNITSDTENLDCHNLSKTTIVINVIC